MVCPRLSGQNREPQRLEMPIEAKELSELVAFGDGRRCCSATLTEVPEP